MTISDLLNDVRQTPGLGLLLLGPAVMAMIGLMAWQLLWEMVR